MTVPDVLLIRPWQNIQAQPDPWHIVRDRYV